ncbi:hypothetical protein BIS09_10770 [Halomonas sp. R1t8]|uniref:DUF7673 family protein n=1 Tax=unclassified Halomonas TaxID=2609666 RepID=UPI000E7D9F81|nr:MULTISPECIES: hypothetical protein [unclassified Halomonas]MCP1304319.1 hypothetical protein [Halomonas sp. R1t8]MCP1329730.1 hypothetical protein [Halomonas sp. R1t4]HBK35741.1 hypothetical protein [Halomonas sp.]
MTTQSSMPRVSERLSQRLSERDHEALEALFADEEEINKTSARLDEQGPDALQRLVQVADGDSGQSHHCRRVLLSVYNGTAWPLDPTRLRVIDRDLQAAALTLIEWSIYAFDEPHTYLNNGEQVMQRFAAIEQQKEQ